MKEQKNQIILVPRAGGTGLADHDEKIDKS
jgi:hypothetical protein